MQAGIPTPSYAEPQTASPGSGGDLAPDGGDPVEVADGVLRQGAAPALDVGLRGPHREPDRVGEVVQDHLDQLVVGDLEGGLLAVAAQGAPQHQHLLARGRSCLADPVPLGEGERRRLHRPAVDRRHQEAGPVHLREGPGREGQGDDRHRGVLDPRERERRGRGDVAEQPGGRSRGRGEDDGVGLDDLGVAGRADHEVPAAVGPAGQVAHGGAGAHGRPGGSCERARQPAHSPADAGEHRGRRGRVRWRGGRGGGPGERPVLLEQRHHLGYGGPGGDLAGVAGVHATEQRLHQPVDDLLAEPFLDQVTDADVALAELGRRAARCPGRRGRGPGRR